MALVKSKRVEHFKVADYSFVELTHEIEGEYETFEDGLKNHNKILKRHADAERAQLAKAFQDGTFDLDEE